MARQSSKKTSPKRTSHTGAIVGIAAATAAAAAGGLFLYGTKEGARTRKKMAALGAAMKKEALTRFKQGREMSEKNYHKAVAVVGKKYAGIKNVDPRELQTALRELKGHWSTIKREIRVGMKAKPKKAAKKGAARKGTTRRGR